MSLRARDELLVVVGGAEEAAVLGVVEVGEQRVAERHRLPVPARVEGRLVEVEQRLEQEGVVLEQPRDGARAQDAPVRRAVVLEQPRRRLGGRPGEARLGQRPDRQPFQPVSTLSSRPGRTRAPRASSSAARIRSRCSAGGSGPRDSRTFAPSKLPSSVAPNHLIAASASGPRTSRSSASDHT
jgi:hypothetical protein